VCVPSFARALGALRFSPFCSAGRSLIQKSAFLSLTRYPYHVYYTVTAVAVVILHIRHMSRLDPDLSELGH
jgi:hypothetical protein